MRLFRTLALVLVRDLYTHAQNPTELSTESAQLARLFAFRRRVRHSMVWIAGECVVAECRGSSEDLERVLETTRDRRERVRTPHSPNRPLETYRGTSLLTNSRYFSTPSSAVGCTNVSVAQCMVRTLANESPLPRFFAKCGIFPSRKRKRWLVFFLFLFSFCFRQANALTRRRARPASTASTRGFGILHAYAPTWRPLPAPAYARTGASAKTRAAPVPRPILVSRLPSWCL